MSEELITITVDGQQYQAAKGAMLIEVTDKAGINIPRFCYHKKLSVAANCRMCLVDVEKAPKPMPACATPVMDGMIVHTLSQRALDAQKSTMEFLLINHPLDCPICDQGGECELQDVAMGYGADVSQYSDSKRVVFEKNIGPLIATEFTRCIHCTRCVRFGDEIAGMRELGGIGRGDSMEISTYIQKSIASEMSGNVIDLCPVGALTAKPSQYTARAWEMTQHAGIAPHDSVGSNVYIHTLRNKVVRVAPRDNEDLNEVWISDRDRFSYQGMYSEDRVTRPLVKENGEWVETEWQTALETSHAGLNKIIKASGAESVAAMVSATSSLEELYLLQKMMRGIGSNNIDHRLRQIDFSDQNSAPVMPWLGMNIKDLEKINSVLLVGSNIRKEQPIVAHRIRKAVRHHDANVSFVNPCDYHFNFNVTTRLITDIASMTSELAAIIRAATEKSGQSVVGHLSAVVNAASVTQEHKDIAAALSADNADKSVVLLGNVAVNHPQFALIRSLSHEIARHTNSQLAYTPEFSNTAGAWLAGALPHRGAGGVAVDKAGLNADDMQNGQIKAFINLNVEPELDSSNSARALAAMRSAEFVIVISAFATPVMKEYADVILPVASFAESSGSYVNMEGFWQTSRGCVPPLGESRPGWKVIRVLANQFDLDGFDQLSSDQIMQELKTFCSDITLDNNAVADSVAQYSSGSGYDRVGDTPIYAGDMLVRRATALQKTSDADVACVRLNSKQAEKLKITAAQKVCVKQNDKTIVMPLLIDESVADNNICIPAGLTETAGLGGAYSTITVENI
ncbi:MAG: NADH-quinone oxidoreductase subunit NuoG [Gammaproteobacteria bacterium]|nr:NADH-quinone oxidoreductase subunit NuoG [Gammaproteobacteria bacterium]